MTMCKQDDLHKNMRMERKENNQMHEDTNTIMKDSWTDGNNVHH